MAKYIFSCDMDHEVMSFEAEAEIDEEAVTKLLEQTKTHTAEMHADMAGKSDEELMEMIRGGMKKEEGM